MVIANEPGKLAAKVLRHQRELSKQTLAEVAKRLGASSINSYAAYEQGKREPSLSKYVELLGAVAPDLTLTLGTRARRPAKAAKATAREAKGKKAARSRSR